MASDKQEEVCCALCNKPQGEHYGSVRWVKCFMCGEKTLDVCLGDDWEDLGIWSCGKCQEVMRKLRNVVSDWDSVKAAVGVGKRSDDRKDRSRRDKMDDMDREVRTWRKKADDRHYELSKMQKQLRHMEEKASMLHSAEAEARSLRQQLAAQQSCSFDRGGGGGNMHNSQQMLPMMPGWQDNSSGGNIHGSMSGFKRPAPFEPLSHSDSPVAKRPATNQRILFVVDNVLRGLVMNQRLQVEFWRKKWEVRLHRGANSDTICNTAMRDLRVDQYDLVVLCAGAIDLEETVRLDEQQCEIGRKRLVSNVLKVAEAALDTGSQVWVIAPPPRKQSLAWQRRACMVDLANAVRPLGPKAGMIFLEEDYDDDLYVHTKLYDGIHIKQEWEVPTIEYILRCMGLDVRISHDDLFTKEEMFGYDVCWRCGGEHKRSVTQCRDFTPCESCGDRGHHTDVCIFICKMCMTCGERGHGPDKCKLK